ncbi:sugar O-acetyltransferase [Lactiplantibacillus brownii]|uniref:sugar O-acetyltransferase n=1 Tax=Lactiplantibacillus brownii TaxID=3069269 RepID=UPI0038B2E2BA
MSSSKESPLTEKEKCFSQMWYDPNGDPSLIHERAQADELCTAINRLGQTSPERQRLLKVLFPNQSKDVTIMNPIWADYGRYTSIGKGTFINRNAYFMDEALITIGANCMIGPNVGLYTANHALVATERNTGIEIALPITLEDNVWLGGNVCIVPGVTIGTGSVIGANSLVSKDIPANVVAAGNPCRVIRKITESDRIAHLIQ